MARAFIKHLTTRRELGTSLGCGELHIKAQYLTIMNWARAPDSTVKVQEGGSLTELLEREFW